MIVGETMVCVVLENDITDSSYWSLAPTNPEIAFDSPVVMVFQPPDVMLPELARRNPPKNTPALAWWGPPAVTANTATAESSELRSFLDISYSSSFESIDTQP